MRDAVAQEFDGACTAVFDDDPGRMRVGADRQVGAPPRLVQIGARRAPAPLAVSRALERASAFLLAIVKIVVARQPGLDPGGNESIGQFPSGSAGPRRAAARRPRVLRSGRAPG